MNVTVVCFLFALDLQVFFSFHFSGSGKIADGTAGSFAEDEAASLCLSWSSKKPFFFVTVEFLRKKGREVNAVLLMY